MSACISTRYGEQRWASREILPGKKEAKNGRRLQYENKAHDQHFNELIRLQVEKGNKIDIVGQVAGKEDEKRADQKRLFVRSRNRVSSPCSPRMRPKYCFISFSSCRLLNAEWRMCSERLAFSCWLSNNWNETSGKKRTTIMPMMKPFWRSIQNE